MIFASQPGRGGNIDSMILPPLGIKLPCLGIIGGFILRLAYSFLPSKVQGRNLNGLIEILFLMCNWVIIDMANNKMGRL